MSQALTAYEGSNAVSMQQQALTPEILKNQVSIVQQAMRAVMKKDLHYGVIKGCGDKPVLLKPGAEVLALTFQFAPKYEVQLIDLGNGHREYSVTCELTHRPTGAYVGQGIGSASTRETKYLYRVGGGEVTGVPVPKDYWDLRKENQSMAAEELRKAAHAGGLEGKKFGTKKNDVGQWMISTHGDRVEHDNPADYYNTCLKMGKKRAFVDAMLTCTAASDIFTQDIDDDPKAFGAKNGEYAKRNMHEIDLQCGQCMTVEELDAVIGSIGIDKTHPDAGQVAFIYNKHKSQILDEQKRIKEQGAASHAE